MRWGARGRTRGNVGHERSGQLVLRIELPHSLLELDQVPWHRLGHHEAVAEALGDLAEQGAEKGGVVVACEILEALKRGKEVLS